MVCNSSNFEVFVYVLTDVNLTYYFYVTVKYRLTVLIYGLFRVILLI